tara:strand:+ start:74 stop:247 length:174 start_codon:yes stop_codon:yes gene_type:complete
MYQVIITKEIKSGALTGMTVQDKFTSSKASDPREIGRTYKGLVHKYKVLNIEYIRIS